MRKHIVLLSFALLFAVSTYGATVVRGLNASPAASNAGATVVPLYGIFEQTFAWDISSYSNPWEQVRLDVSLTAPSGRNIEIAGFYYALNTWKARFAPDEIGAWMWAAAISDGTRSRDLSGIFTVVPSSSHGFVRQSSYDKFRWVFEDGTPYYPLGFQDCITHTKPPGQPFDSQGIAVAKAVPLEEYFRTYAGAGVNLYRWTLNNCTFGLYQTIDPSGNVYLLQASQWGDELVQMLRRNGYRIYMTLFGYAPPFPTDSTDPAQMDAVKRYMKYVSDRYGPTWTSGS